MVEPVETTSRVVEPVETTAPDPDQPAGLRPDDQAGTPARSYLARPPDPGQPRRVVRAAPGS
jgi:hypothetical protein